jgi:3-methyladenine DNA glycosylase AlkD
MQTIIEAFYQNRNQERALQMATYMKNNFAFLGLTKPERADLQSAFIKYVKKRDIIDWDFIFSLWDLPEREFQYLALDYLLELKILLQRQDIEKIQALITQKSWWDTVDSLAPIAGLLCIKFPELIESYILKWANSENIWLARAAILFQLKYKEKTDSAILSSIIRYNSHTKEFFINKAIGWALREYSKTNKEWVKGFIENNHLHPLSVREGSKYII